MKKLLFICAAIVTSLAVYMRASDSPVRSFEGEISDSQCALNVHSLTRSHQEMLKSKSHGTSPADCVLYCVDYLGGRFVLVAGKKIYRLDNDTLVRKFAADKVKVTGVADAKDENIHVITIEKLN